MKIKNATIKDFDTAYEYIKKLWDYNTYDYETTKEVYKKVLQDENSFAFFAVLLTTDLVFTSSWKQ